MQHRAPIREAGHEEAPTDCDGRSRQPGSRAHDVRHEGTFNGGTERCHHHDAGELDGGVTARGDASRQMLLTPVQERDGNEEQSVEEGDVERSDAKQPGTLLYAEQAGQPRSYRPEGEEEREAGDARDRHGGGFDAPIPIRRFGGELGDRLRQTEAAN